MSALLGDLRAWARREPALAALFAVAAAASITPLWVGRYVPLLDYPNHLSMVFVWLHLDDPRWNFAPYYAKNLVPLPYWAEYGTVYLLGYVFGVELAHKLFVTISVLALPASVAVWARRAGRDPRLALLSFPLAWNFSMGAGFLSYCAGLPALLFALAALDAYAESPSWRRAALASLLGASLYFFHILVWAVYLAVGGATALLAARPLRIRRVLLAPLPAFPALAVGVIAWKAAGAMAVTVKPASRLADFSALWHDPAGLLESLPFWLTDLVRDSIDEYLLFALILVWALMVAARPLCTNAQLPIDTNVHPARDRDPRAWRAELAALVAFALLFLLPRSLVRPFYWYAINRRVGIVLALCAVACVRGPLTGPRRKLLFIAGLISVLSPLHLAAHFRSVSVRARDYEAVIAAAPPGKQVLPLMVDVRDPDVHANIYNQWGTWVQLRQGGYILYNLDMDFPIRYLKKLPAPSWDSAVSFDFAKHEAGWDYFLLRGAGKRDLFGKHRARVRLVKQQGDWELWEKLPPR